MKKRIIFRDKKGRFISYANRYSKKVAKVQAFRGGRYVEVLDVAPTPKNLVSVLNRTEFETLPPAERELKTFASKNKYKAWDIAGQLDKTKGIRRKLLKVEMEVFDGKRKRKVSFYTQVNRNASAQGMLFRRMNEEAGAGGFNFYRNFRGKRLTNRKGKTVTLGKVKLYAVE